MAQTDASDVGLGAALAQEYNGEEHPVAFFSRKLNMAEHNYSTSEKECLAVVEGVKAFALYRIGSAFTIVTDHAALKSLQTTTKSGPRVTRWALVLQPFNFSISHRAGKKHLNADGLSRQAWDKEPVVSPASLWKDHTGPQTATRKCDRTGVSASGGGYSTLGRGAFLGRESQPEEGAFQRRGGCWGQLPTKDRTNHINSAHS
jgi:phospholipid-translocating ATPase